MDPIINKVAESGLVTIDLETFRLPGERVLFDIAPWLFEEMILKESLFREHIKQHDWSQYVDKFVAIHCTADAIVPTWAYMLVAASLKPFAHTVCLGDRNALEEILFMNRLNSLDLTQFKDQRIVIKGCSKENVPVSAYVHLVDLLQPIVKSILYGEPCSTVPVYKRKNT
jgi:hypothetical protein